jgi:hypothetical protein
VGLEYIGPYFYIAPGDTALSEVYRRITGRATPRMPFNGPYLSPFQISKFANWILEGALNN